MKPLEEEEALGLNGGNLPSWEVGDWYRERSELSKWLWGTDRFQVSLLSTMGHCGGGWGRRDQNSSGYNYARVASSFGAGACIEVLGRREPEGVGHHWSRLVLGNEF